MCSLPLTMLDIIPCPLSVCIALSKTFVMRMGGVVLRERSTDWGYRIEHKNKFASVLDAMKNRILA